MFTWKRHGLVDVKDALLGSGKNVVRVVGSVSFLLHCNASNLVLEVLEHDKISGEAICI